MKSSAVILGFMFCWIFLFNLIPDNKRWKGHFWRTLRKLPVARGYGNDHALWICYWLLILGTVIWFNISVAWLYLIDSARLVDDWLNADDDDYKKKWERAKNKIKWKLAKPAPVVVKH